MMSYYLDTAADWNTLPATVQKGIARADPKDVGPRDWQTVCLAIRDHEGAVVAGLYGATMWSWLMIDGLWVAANQRGQGPGRQLLRTAEEIAIQRGCVGTSLGAFDFGAKTFYEHLGYSVFAELSGFPPGHSHVQLHKRFAIPSSRA